jgi:hypothetical protein
MSPLRRRMIEDMQIRNLTRIRNVCMSSRSSGSPAIFANRRNFSGRLRSGPI